MKLQQFPQPPKTFLAICISAMLLQCDLLNSNSNNSLSNLNPEETKNSQSPSNSGNNKNGEKQEYPLPGDSAGVMPSGGDIWDEICFWGEDASDKQWPLVKIFHKENTRNGIEVIDLTVVFNRNFVDNTYGMNSIGWNPRRGHWFSDLYKSDHTELLLENGKGKDVYHAKIDLLSPDGNAPSGYASQGVTGGDGQVFIGKENDIVEYTTSLDDNLNLHGYHLLKDSPPTDANFTQNPDYPKWNFYVTYSISVKKEIFGTSGFGKAHMTYVHASPSKMPHSETIIVQHDKCPDHPDSPDDPGGLPPEIPTGENPPHNPDTPDEYEPSVPG